ncbi:uncharacterized protein LOC128229291 [Mya arenaria]|uniref:uncharacterized protein LOC128229291 n=1 Tax=Mya arenaria TaxID=6604 RepID=UPI0022DFC4FF|nr:uncharacterized protein LOC128229291 [Mya arenaria]
MYGRRRPSLSKLWVGSALLLDVGYMLHVVGISTTWWTTRHDIQERIGSGLWDIGLYQNLGWLTATRVLEATGLAFALLALLVVVFLVCLPRYFHWSLRLFAVFASVIAGILVLAGIGVYADKVRHDFHYSFALSCTAGLLFIITGSLLAVDTCLIHRHNSRPHTQGHHRQSEYPYNSPFVLSDFGHPSNHGGHESAGYGHMSYGDQWSGDRRAYDNTGFDPGGHYSHHSHPPSPRENDQNYLEWRKRHDLMYS